MSPGFYKLYNNSTQLVNKWDYLKHYLKTILIRVKVSLCFYQFISTSKEISFKLIIPSTYNSTLSYDNKKNNAFQFTQGKHNFFLNSKSYARRNIYAKTKGQKKNHILQLPRYSNNFYHKFPWIWPCIYLSAKQTSKHKSNFR